MHTDVREALAELLEMYFSTEPRTEEWFIKYNGVWERARAALAASPQVEPVAELREGHDGFPWLEAVIIDQHEAARLGEGAKLYASPKPAQAEPDKWQKLYRRAINEANGLTNYVEDRPELRSAEKRITKIEEEARALAATPKRTEG